MFRKFYGTKFYFLYLCTAFLYTFCENFSSLFTPYMPLYRQCEKLLRENNDIDYLIISGTPFHLFKFGYKLKKKFNIRWIADYRDDWNTNNLMQSNFFKKLLRKISVHYEKKWVLSADFFVSVTDLYVNKIHNLLKKITGYTISNGYIESNYVTTNNEVSGEFIISYAGSLYNTQPVEVFLTAYKKFVDKNGNAPASKVVFVGLEGNPPLLSIVKKLTEGYENYFEYTLRVSKKEAIAIQNRSTVLLAIGYGNRKGIPGSKVYEYVALRKPVLICPSDNDIMEEILRSTNQAIVANNADECFKKLQRLYSEFQKNGKIIIQINDAVTEQYTRRAQAGKLAAIMTENIKRRNLIS